MLVYVVTMCRSLKSLAWAGAVGLFLALGFSSLTVVLVVLAALQGELASISWLPNPDLTGPDVKDKILGVFSTLPVIALAYVCHYNVHPLVIDHHTTSTWCARRAPFCSPCCSVIKTAFLHCMGIKPLDMCFYSCGS